MGNDPLVSHEINLGSRIKMSDKHCFGREREPFITGLEPQFFLVLGTFNVPLKSSLSTGHRSPKPAVVSQLEREEEPWGTETHTQRGGRSAESCAAGVLGGKSR